MKPIVLDASALIAYLWKEQGWQNVEKHLLGQSVLISVVNVYEVAAKAMERGVDEATTRDIIEALDLQQMDFVARSVWDCARLRVKTKVLGLSLGDRACLALAQSQDCAAVTADKAWLKLNLGIQIECIR